MLCLEVWYWFGLSVLSDVINRINCQYHQTKIVPSIILKKPTTLKKKKSMSHLRVLCHSIRYRSLGFVPWRWINNFTLKMTKQSCLAYSEHRKTWDIVNDTGIVVWRVVGRIKGPLSYLCIGFSVLLYFLCVRPLGHCIYEPSTLMIPFLSNPFPFLNLSWYIHSCQGISSYGRECEDGGGDPEAGLWREFGVHQRQKDSCCSISLWNRCMPAFCRLPETFLSWFPNLYTSAYMG